MFLRFPDTLPLKKCTPFFYSLFSGCLAVPEGEELLRAFERISVYGQVIAYSHNQLPIPAAGSRGRPVSAGLSVQMEGGRSTMHSPGGEVSCFFPFGQRWMRLLTDLPFYSAD